MITWHEYKATYLEAEAVRLRTALEVIAALQRNEPFAYDGVAESLAEVSAEVREFARDKGRYEAAEVARKALGGGK